MSIKWAVYPSSVLQEAPQHTSDTSGHNFSFFLSCIEWRRLWNIWKVHLFAFQLRVLWDLEKGNRMDKWRCFKFFRLSILWELSTMQNVQLVLEDVHQLCQESVECCQWSTPSLLWLSSSSRGNHPPSSDGSLISELVLCFHLDRVREREIPSHSRITRHMATTVLNEWIWIN